MALVTVDDNGVMVCLPDGKKIDYHNRTSVIVKTNDGKAVEGVSVNVYDNAGGDRTEITDKDGKITVPPLNENIIENKPTPTNRAQRINRQKQKSRTRQSSRAKRKSRSLP